MMYFCVSWLYFCNPTNPIVVSAPCELIHTQRHTDTQTVGCCHLKLWKPSCSFQQKHIQCCHPSEDVCAHQQPLFVLWSQTQATSSSHQHSPALQTVSYTWTNTAYGFCFVHKWLSCLFGTGHRGFRVLAGQDADIEGVEWTDGWLVDRMRNKRTRCVSQIRKILFQHHSTTIGTNWHREGAVLVALSMGSRWTYSLCVCVAVCRIINAYLETSNRDRLCMLTRWQLAMSHQDCLYVTAYGHF